MALGTLPHEAPQHELLRGFVEVLFKGLSDQKKARVDKLIAHLKVSDNADEQREIVDAIIEIVHRALPAGKRGVRPVSAKAGLDPKAIRSVEAYRKDIGARIKQRRQALRMTQQALADKAGLPQSHVARLESGKHAPTDVTIEKLARALGTPPEQLDLLYA